MLMNVYNYFSNFEKDAEFKKYILNEIEENIEFEENFKNNFDNYNDINNFGNFGELNNFTEFENFNEIPNSYQNNLIQSQSMLTFFFHPKIYENSNNP